jgi:hypothetical protein
VSSLERELTALASSVEWPETPDVASVLATRFDELPQSTRRPLGRLAVVVAVIVATLLAVLAVPQARSAIFGWLGIGGARIVRVDALPSLPPVQDLDVLGAPATTAEVRQRAGFPFADPPHDEPPPDERRLAPGLRVSYVWRDGPRVRLLITQFPGRVGDPALVKKLTGRATVVDLFRLDGNAAVWLEGGPHAVLFVTADGMVRDDQGWLAGNTLLVDGDGTTIRVEGSLDRDDAIDLVRAMGANPSSEG